MKCFLINLSTTVILVFLSITGFSQGGLCNRVPDVLLVVSNTNIEAPHDETMAAEFLKLNQCLSDLWQTVSDIKGIHVLPYINKKEWKKHDGYVLQTLFSYVRPHYKFIIILKTACSDKIVLQSETSFSMYPSWDPPAIFKTAFSKVDFKKVIEDFEKKERDENNYGIGGDLWGGKISIKMNAEIKKGMEVLVEMKVIDCDETILKNQQISTEGTIGGTFKPSIFYTNDKGVAFAKLTITSDEMVLIKASCVTKNIYGCTDLYTGSDLTKPHSKTPVTVNIQYKRKENSFVHHVGITGIIVEDSYENENTNILHYSNFYNIPSVEARKDGYLIDASSDESAQDSKTFNIEERGTYKYYKMLKTGNIKASVKELEMFIPTISEDNEITSYTYVATLEHPSELTFFEGNENEPPQISWDVKYPIPGGDFITVGIILTKGDPDVTWETGKVSIDKSGNYKTWYRISKMVNLGLEAKMGDGILKDLIGMDINEIGSALNPQNSKKNLFQKNGFEEFTVFILSPYPEKPDLYKYDPN